MKKILLIVLALLLILTSCTMSENVKYEAKEQPHLYWKDIDVVVTSVDRRHWYASTHWYEVKISVESEEYQLTHTDTFKGSGILGCPPQWLYNEGDAVKAKLYSWVIDSTGEIIKREINRIY